MLSFQTRPARFKWCDDEAQISSLGALTSNHSVHLPSGLILRSLDTLMRYLLGRRRRPREEGSLWSASLYRCEQNTCNPHYKPREIRFSRFRASGSLRVENKWLCLILKEANSIISPANSLFQWIISSKTSLYTKIHFKNELSIKNKKQQQRKRIHTNFIECVYTEWKKEI